MSLVKLSESVSWGCVIIHLWANDLSQSKHRDPALLFLFFCFVLPSICRSVNHWQGSATTMTWIPLYDSCSSQTQHFKTNLFLQSCLPSGLVCPSTACNLFLSWRYIKLVVSSLVRNSKDRRRSLCMFSVSWNFVCSHFDLEVIWLFSGGWCSQYDAINVWVHTLCQD